MNRKEVYAKIKELKLQNEIKVKFGDNFTRIPTDKLSAFIAEKSVKVKSTKEKNVKKSTTKEEVKETKQEPQTVADMKAYIMNAVSKMDRVINFLQEKHILLKSEVNYIHKGQEK